MEQPSWSEGRLRDETREGFEKVDKRFDKVDERFEKVDKRFDKVDERFEKVDKRFDRVDDEFKAIRAEIKSGFDRMYRLLLVGAFGIIAALLTAPHL